MLWAGFNFVISFLDARFRTGRECLDHVIVLNQAHLHRLLKSYFSYYHRVRTHLALDKDAPEPRVNFIVMYGGGKAAGGGDLPFN